MARVIQLLLFLPSFAANSIRHIATGDLPTSYLLLNASWVATNTFLPLSVPLIPSVNGSNVVLFAFRHDPGYFELRNPSLTCSNGAAGNLLLNSDFALTYSLGSIFAPTEWGVFYESVVTPSSAGSIARASAPQKNAEKAQAKRYRRH